jgi:hypothetical protein
MNKNKFEVHSLDVTRLFLKQNIKHPRPWRQFVGTSRSPKVGRILRS